jgi:hypothetical protein
MQELASFFLLQEEIPKQGLQRKFSYGRHVAAVEISGKRIITLDGRGSSLLIPNGKQADINEDRGPVIYTTSPDMGRMPY